MGSLFFLGGCLFSRQLLTVQPIFPNFFNSASSLCDVENTVKYGIVGQKMRTCPICAAASCARHSDGMLAHREPPWRTVRVPQHLNASMEAFIEQLLKNYLYSWYADVSPDAQFVFELRYNIRHITAVLWQRLEKLDLAELILQKLIPCSVCHLDAYVDVCRQYASLNLGEALEQRTLEALKPNLHHAVYSRDAELNYLRQLAARLIDIALEPDPRASQAARAFVQEALSTIVLLPVLDILTDPDILNRLLLILFSPEPMVVYTEPLSPLVEILHGLTTPNPEAKALLNSAAQTDSLLQPKLSDMLSHDPQLLYVFMSFMKAEQRPLNYLQFLLAAQEVLKCLRDQGESEPESTAKLQYEAWELFIAHFHESAPDYVPFPDGITRQYKFAIEGRRRSVSDNANHAVSYREHSPADALPTQLKEVHTALELAYKFAFDYLQQYHVTPFCQSAAFFELLAGSPKFASTPASSTGGRSRGTSSDESWLTFAKFRRNVARVFGGSVEEGIAPSGPDVDLVVGDDLGDVIADEEDLFDIEGSAPSSMEDDEDDTSSLAPDFTGAPRDLSAWYVNIPRIEPRRDPQSQKTMYVYVCEVLDTDLPTDNPDRQWTVDRRYHEFYVLESKLSQFHGSVIPVDPLPAKKAFGTKTRAFCENMRPTFDKYLKSLLQVRELHGSELIYMFLKSHDEFTNSFLPDLNPIRAIRKVPARFVRERGQHLTPFLHTFVLSTESFRQKPRSQLSAVPSAHDVKSIASGASTTSETSMKERIYHSPLYGNNASIPKIEMLDSLSVSNKNQRPVFSGVFDVVMYLARKVYCASNVVLWFFTAVRTIGKATIEAFAKYFLKEKLRMALHERRMAELVDLLRFTVFEEESVERTVEERNARAQEAWQYWLLFFDELLPPNVRYLLGLRQLEQGHKYIFNCLQNPRLNKQLAYQLLDKFLLEVFPELESMDKT